MDSKEVLQGVFPVNGLPQRVGGHLTVVAKRCVSSPAFRITLNPPMFNMIHQPLSRRYQVGKHHVLQFLKGRSIHSLSQLQPTSLGYTLQFVIEQIASRQISSSQVHQERLLDTHEHTPSVEQCKMKQHTFLPRISPLRRSQGPAPKSRHFVKKCHASYP